MRYVGLKYVEIGDWIGDQIRDQIRGEEEDEFKDQPRLINICLKIHVNPS